MQALDRSLRNAFEKTVLKARAAAEDAARAAIGELGVAEAAEAAYLSPERKELRKKLRAHARQLGDEPAADGTQGTDRLVEEIAYEHWHRMLFARFLAENELLMYPDPVSPVAVTLADCDDLAKEEGAVSGWELAARYAARMLPQIFKEDAPVFSLVLPPEYQQKLEALVKELPNDIFTASDSLGWAYQFWQSDNKERINKAEVKIGARELPAVTQLFTEPYMVSFLLDNSLGAWWASRRLSEDDLRNAATEEELRTKASLPGVPLEYLRFVKSDDGAWTPAAGTFEQWPDHLKDFKALDPCCGSGHFLVALLRMLVPLRMEMEGLSAREAVDRALSENIHGLELDSRCVELAAFALAFAAWRYPGSCHYRPLPALNVACSGLAVNVSKKEWMSVASGDVNAGIILGHLYDQFLDASTFGSLLRPDLSLNKNSFFEVEWSDIGPLLEKAITIGQDYNGKEIGIIAKGLARAADLLVLKYDLVITNVPYLKSGNHSDKLKIFCKEFYPKSKYDLATVFIQRCYKFLKATGSLAVVTQQYWLFLKYYDTLRDELLQTIELGYIARLGPGAFETINGEVVNVCLHISHNKKPLKEYVFSITDVGDIRNYEDKMKMLVNKDIARLFQEDQEKNPDKRITSECSSNSGDMLSIVADFGKGSVSGDAPHYLRKFWEFSQITTGMRKWLNRPENDSLWSGREDIILWDSENNNPEKEFGFRYHGQRVFNKKGVAIGKAGKLIFTPYTGEIFDDNLAVICPYNESDLESIWNFCISGDLEREIRKLDKKMSITAGTFTKVPFSVSNWNKKKNSIGIRVPQTNDEKQWIFHGDPAFSEDPLQVAVARLLGYRWPAELDPDMELADEQHALVTSCETLLSYADTDGIVCIPAVRGERSAEDRLLDLLVAAYGSAWKSDTLGSLLAASDHAGKTLETWLRDKFFSQHCKLFGHRPFIWQIWDELKDGFSALVNYHTLDYKKLETLIYTYLGDWIIRQKLDLTNKVDGAQEKLDAAERLKKKLELILQGEAPYDIFVRWKPLAEQSIGWNPDLNDGVRLNIRPFITAEVLRHNKKPQINISWDKDRGKDVESAPWYKVFGGVRINDHHLSLEEKTRAREGER